jgi:hypothetical protein
VSLFGEVTLQFAYYHCACCGKGCRPWCDKLRLGKPALTPAAEEIAAMAGVLHKMAGLRLSESTVERTTETAGHRVRQQLQQGKPLGPTHSWTWQRDACGRRCAYVSLDATGVRRQGPGGHHAEGRMAYVGMVYNPRSEHDPKRPPSRQVRYLSGFFELDALGRQLHREALEVGWANADQHIALSDGGAGLEQFFKRFFPKAVCILDFYHAKEYLVS